MKTLEEMEANMRLDELRQKSGVPEDKKKPRKSTMVVEPIQLDLIQKDIDKLYYQIYAYFTVNMHIFLGNKFNLIHLFLVAHVRRVGRIYAAASGRGKAKWSWQKSGCLTKTSSRIYQAIVTSFKEKDIRTGCA